MKLLSLTFLFLCCYIICPARVYAGPVISPSGPVDLCTGQSQTLSVTGVTGTATYQWRKDGADIVNATNATYSANASGSYTVVVTQNSTPTESDPVTVTIHALPTAGFTFSPANQCPSVPVQFTNTSVGTNLTYAWTFGDVGQGAVNTSTDKDPVHRYIGSSGTSTQSMLVTLNVKDQYGCTGSSTQSFLMQQSPSLKLSGPNQDVYNGLTYFKSCSSATSTANFSFSNLSNTANSNYRIIWGDGTADYNAATITNPLTHNFGVGSFSLQFIVTGNNGCTDTGYYYIFAGANPAVGLGNPGNTAICTGSSLTFPVSSTATNPPGTTYTVSFNDGSSSQVYTTAPVNVSHTFDKTSCNTTSGTFSNSFSATITASNPCATSAASVVPIYVSQRPTAVINVSSDTLCTNTTATFNNISPQSNSVNTSGQCSPGKAVWSISPATGWTSTDNFGNDYGGMPPVNWDNGSSSIGVRFTVPGTYVIRLKVGNDNCGTDFIEKTICVNPIADASFTLDNTAGCKSLDVSATNTSSAPNCGNNRYVWNVTYQPSDCNITTAAYTFTNGSSATSTNPSFRFTNPGNYTVTLTTIRPGFACQASLPKTVTVKDKPSVTLNPLSNFCQNANLQSKGNVQNCNATSATYNWDFTGATPATASGTLTPTVVYTSSGTYTRSLSVTNECGTTVVTDQVTIDPTPTVTVPANTPYCKGATVPATNFPTGGGITYTWTNSNTSIGLFAVSGTGNVPQFVANNTSSTPITTTITVTPKQGNCTGPSQAYTITVNPVPAAPATSPIAYCLNATASPLTASGNTLNWYTSVPPGASTTTAPTPLTTSVGTTTYWVTQTNSYSCESNYATLAVTIQPAIEGNGIVDDETICVSGAKPAIITQDPLVTLKGGTGTYTYQWQQSATPPPGTWSNTGTNSSSFQPPVLNATTYYKRIITSGACSAESNVITKTILSALTGTNITAPQTICAGATPALLNGETAGGGSGSFTYSWESSPNNSTWTTINGEANKDLQPSSLTTTTYYRRKIAAGSCNATSNTIQITVNPLPAGNVTALANYCSNAATNLTFSPTAGTAPFTITLDYTDPSAASHNFSQVTSGSSPYALPLLPANSAAGSYSYTVSKIKDANGCENTGPFTTKQFTITQQPTVNATAVNPVICAGQSSVLTASGADTYQWTPPATLSGSTGSTVTATPPVTTTYTVTGTTNGCVATNTVLVTVNAATPAAQAGPDTHLCATNAYTMQATLPAGTSGAWTQTAGQSVTINDPSSPNTAITGLQAGNTYQFTWTLTGAAVCPTKSATVIITNDGALTNTLNSAPPTVCSGQPVTVSGPVATGGSGTYAYSWEQSTDNISGWTTLAGQTGASITFVPAGTVYVRRKVTTSTCTGASNSILVTVQASISANTISGDQAICTGNSANTITGSVPTGGDGNYQFQWQVNTSGNTWTAITGAQAANYAPGILTATTRYRRLATTSLCAGSQASTSPVVTITVNPDAIAAYTYAKLQDCAPFTLTAQQITATTDATRNSNYTWFADGTQIGSGAAFPGYTISQPGASVAIKLKAISLYGCKNDSVSYTFSTPALPTVSFTTDISEGWARWQYNLPIQAVATTAQVIPGILVTAPATPALRLARTPLHLTRFPVILRIM
ncbi:MAG: PKD domain-containing protein [Filimonas sp.]|nr:PKD domain-containing protein [Filimonas sp.]